MNIFKIVLGTFKKPLTAFLLGMFITSLVFGVLVNAEDSPTPSGAVPGNTATGTTTTLILGGDDSTDSTDSDSKAVEIPLNGGRDKPMPADYLDDSQIRVYQDRVIINVKNVKWAGFADTKSMLPILGKDSNALQIEPVCPDEIQIGDIVSYRSKYADGIIIHRVIDMNQDSKGVYFVLKGDNNPTPDPGKIRCEQIERKVIGILY